MKKHFWLVLLILVVVPLLLLYLVTFTVDFRQVAIVKTFGKAGPAIDGATQAGLHFKWPWPVQELVRYDARVHVFDDTYEQIVTADKQNVIVTAYCGWRIKDPATFLNSVRTEQRAEEQLRKIVRSRKSAVLAEHTMSELVNTDPKKMQIPEIEAKIRQGVQRDVEKEYGVEVVTLGVKSLGLPKTVTDKVIALMKEERNRFAQLHKAQGQSEAQMIKARAEAARKQILDFADAKAWKIRSEGDEAAARYYSVYRRNEGFAMFLREMDFMRQALKDKTVIVGSGNLAGCLNYFSKEPTAADVEAAATRPAVTTRPAPK